MKSKIIKILLACAICTAALGTGCILEDKVVQVIFTGQTSAEFSQNSQSEEFLNTTVVNYTEQIDEILADNDIGRDEIETALLVSASYGVTSYQQAGDWVISGAILVNRQDITIAEDTLVSYTDQSVRDALGKKIPAKTHAAGINIINQALSDYIAGTHNPVIEFTVVNSTVDPTPSAGNPIIFDWKAWLIVQVILENTFEVPDPF